MATTFANMTHRATMLNGHKGQTVMYICTQYDQLQKKSHSLLPNICQKQICPTNVICVSHMPLSSHADIRQLCQYIYII